MIKQEKAGLFAPFVKRTMRISFLGAAVIALFAMARGHTGWAAGFLVSVMWSVINLSLLVSATEMLVIKPAPSKLSTTLLVKFPLLYAAGYFILRYRLFPLQSILSGIALTMAAIAVTIISRKRL